MEILSTIHTNIHVYICEYTHKVIHTHIHTENLNVRLTTVVSKYRGYLVRFEFQIRTFSIGLSQAIFGT